MSEANHARNKFFCMYIDNCCLFYFCCLFLFFRNQPIIIENYTHSMVEWRRRKEKLHIFYYFLQFFFISLFFVLLPYHLVCTTTCNCTLAICVFCLPTSDFYLLYCEKRSASLLYWNSEFCIKNSAFCIEKEEN